jgi:hypothetical protein
MGQEAAPQRLNLGCGTLLGGICVIVLLGRLLPHEAIRPASPAKAEARNPDAGPRRTTLPPQVASSPKPSTHSTGAVRLNAGKPQGSSGDRPVVFNDPWNGAVWQVERYLKQHLHDATSFEALEWGPVTRNAKGYQVRCKFRSKNVLGVYATQSKTFYLSRSGDVYAVKE